MRRGRYDDYYDEVYGRTPPRRRRKKRGRGFLLLLVLLLALGALYMVRSGGLRVLSVPEENIETDFEVDLEALAARITPDMAGADGLGAADAGRQAQKNNIIQNGAVEFQPQTHVFGVCRFPRQMFFQHHRNIAGTPQEADALFTGILTIFQSHIFLLRVK